VCFNSREAQHVVLDQLQAIILQVNMPRAVPRPALQLNSCSRHASPHQSANVCDHRGAAAARRGARL
jgi:hypothetical protein